MIVMSPDFLVAPKSFGYETEKKGMYLSGRSRGNMRNASMPQTFHSLGFVNLFGCNPFVSELAEVQNQIIKCSTV